MQATLTPRFSSSLRTSMPKFLKEMRFRPVAPTCCSSTLRTSSALHSSRLESSPRSLSVSASKDVLRRLSPFSFTRPSRRTSNCFPSFTTSLSVKMRPTKGSRIFWLSQMRKESSKFLWISSQMLWSSQRKEEQSRLCAHMWSQVPKKQPQTSILAMTATHPNQTRVRVTARTVRIVRTLNSTRSIRLTLSSTLIPFGRRLSSRCLTQESALRRRTRSNFSSCLAAFRTPGRWTPRVLAWGLLSLRTLSSLSTEGLEWSPSMEEEPSLLSALSLVKTTTLLTTWIMK